MTHPCFLCTLERVSVSIRAPIEQQIRKPSNKSISACVAELRLRTAYDSDHASNEGGGFEGVVLSILFESFPFLPTAAFHSSARIRSP